MFDIRPSDDDIDSLLRACGEDEPATVEEWLQQLQDPNRCKKDGITGMHRAAEFGSVECMKLLLEARGFLDNKSENGWTAVDLATEYERVDCLRLLLEARGNPNSEVEKSCSPLHLAAESGSVGCLKLLLDAHSFPNSEDETGCTALHSAANSGWVDCLRLLLEARGDPYLKDEDDDTVFSLTSNYNGPEAELMMQLLLEAVTDKDCLHTTCFQPEQSDPFKTDVWFCSVGGIWLPSYSKPSRFGPEHKTLNHKPSKA